MDDCECGAHFMQDCNWWCGKGLTRQQIWGAENPTQAKLERIEGRLNSIFSKLESKETLEKL